MTAPKILKPNTPEQIAEAVQWALSERTAFEVRGLGTKHAWGRPSDAHQVLDLSDCSGIVLYEPEELVLSTHPATPIQEIASLLAEHDQQLAFEPADYSALLGGASSGARNGGTIGGAIACNLSGPRRIKIGAARDHILGFQAVTGRGEAFKSGGRMFKNVTGFDLSKLMCGSFGTLAVFTELTFKVLPAPEDVRTVLVVVDEVAEAARAMTISLQSQNDASGAAFLPSPVAKRSAVSLISGAGKGIAALRLEGFGPSVDYRASELAKSLSEFGEVSELTRPGSLELWREIRDVSYFSGEDDRQVWRLSVPPTNGPDVVAEVLASLDGDALFDWGGGLVWLAISTCTDAGHGIVRQAAARHGGYATLVRAGADVRAHVPVFHPQAPALAALTERVKESFDPHRVLNPGRMYAGI